MTTPRQIWTDPDLLRAVKRATDEFARSPQQKEVAETTAALVLGLVAEMGLESTVLPALRAEAQQMRRLIGEAQQARSEFSALANPEGLDDRARNIVALSAVLLETFRAKVAPSPSVDAQIVRAVSFIVWQYAANGHTPPPTELEAEEWDGSRTIPPGGGGPWS